MELDPAFRGISKSIYIYSYNYQCIIYGNPQTDKKILICSTLGWLYIPFCISSLDIVYIIFIYHYCITIQYSLYHHDIAIELMILMSEFMILMSTHHHITMIYDYNPLYTKYPLYHHHIPLHTHLVGGLEYVLFSHILGIIIPTDFHIFQRSCFTTNPVIDGHISHD